MKAYYVRIAQRDRSYFELHLTSNNADWKLLSVDYAKSLATAFYLIRMDTEQALSLKLSFPLLGCLDFEKTLGQQVTSVDPK